MITISLVVIVSCGKGSARVEGLTDMNWCGCSKALSPGLYLDFI